MQKEDAAETKPAPWGGGGECVYSTDPLEFFQDLFIDTFFHKDIPETFDHIINNRFVEFRLKLQMNWKQRREKKVTIWALRIV